MKRSQSSLPLVGKAPRRAFSNPQLLKRFDCWLEITGKSQNTRINYGLGIKQFDDFLRGKPFSSVQTQDVRGFLAHLFDRNLLSVTIQARLCALRAFYDFLRMGDQVSTAAPRYVRNRKVPKRLPHAISEVQMRRLIEAADSPRTLAILELAYASGLRVGELAQLRVEDLDLVRRTLLVRRGKGGSDRVGFFGKAAADALKTYIGPRDHGRVFQPLPQRKQLGGVWRNKRGVWLGQWREADASGRRLMRTVRLGDYEISTRAQARMKLKNFFEEHWLREKETRYAPDRGITTRQIWRIIAKASRRADIGHVHPHVLRHSCATHCLNNGMDIRFVKELLGHVRLQTTVGYLHIANAKLVETYHRYHPHGGMTK